MKFDVVFVAGPAAVRSGVGNDFSMPNEWWPPAGLVAPAGGADSVPDGDETLAVAASKPRPPDSSNRPVDAEPSLTAAVKTGSRDQVPDLPKVVGPLNVQGAPRSLGEGPLTDDPLGAGGDLQVGVWRKQSLSLADVTVPIDVEAHDNLPGGHLIGPDLPAPRDLHPAGAHRPIRRKELLFSEIVRRALPFGPRVGGHDRGRKLAWSVAVFCRGRDVHRCAGHVDPDSAGRAELIAQSCESRTGQFG